MSLIDDTFALISQPRYGISTIYPGVVVEEVSQDALGITKHPVEIGAVVTDHSFKLPVRLDMLCGWSDSSAGYVAYILEIYNSLLALQATRDPFSITTPKRRYPDMLFSGLAVQNDHKTATALMVRASFEQIIITSTRSAGGGSASIAPNSAQAEPQRTGSITERGPVTPIPIQPGGVGGYDPVLGLGPSGASAGFDEITFDGVTQPGLPALTDTTDPRSLPGNLGLFGSYGPDVFTNPRPFRI